MPLAVLTIAMLIAAVGNLITGSYILGFARIAGISLVALTVFAIWKPFSEAANAGHFSFLGLIPYLLLAGTEISARTLSERRGPKIVFVPTQKVDEE